MARCNPSALSEQPFRFREHYYETRDPMEEVRRPGYFAAAARHLAAGDVIKVRAGIGGALEYGEFLVERPDGDGLRLRSLSAPVRDEAPRPEPRPAEPARPDHGRHMHNHGRGGRR